MEPPKSETFLALEWCGPFLVRDGEFQRHPMESADTPKPGGGLYIFHGMNLLLGGSGLMYIGQTKDLAGRLAGHRWLDDEWQVEAFVAPCRDSRLRVKAEKLLIYAHQPPGNSQHISERPKLSKPLRIWNTGRFWGLYPEVSSAHPWNSK